MLHVLQLATLPLWCFGQPDRRIHLLFWITSDIDEKREEIVGCLESFQSLNKDDRDHVHHAYHDICSNPRYFSSNSQAPYSVTKPVRRI